jgi:hypothetical protein
MNRLMTIATDAGPWIEKMELSDTGGINNNLRAEAVEREGTGSISWITSHLDAMWPTLHTPRGRYPSGLGWRRYDAEWAWRIVPASSGTSINETPGSSPIHQDRERMTRGLHL